MSATLGDLVTYPQLTTQVSVSWFSVATDARKLCSVNHVTHISSAKSMSFKFATGSQFPQQMHKPFLSKLNTNIARTKNKQRANQFWLKI